MFQRNVEDVAEGVRGPWQDMGHRGISWTPWGHLCSHLLLWPGCLACFAQAGVDLGPASEGWGRSSPKHISFAVNHYAIDDVVPRAH